jgi:AraC-like DNA-binding protein
MSDITTIVAGGQVRLTACLALVLRPSWNGVSLFSGYWRLYWHEEDGVRLELGSRSIPLEAGLVYLLSPGLDICGRVQGSPTQFFMHFLLEGTCALIPRGIHAFRPTAELQRRLRSCRSCVKPGDWFPGILGRNAESDLLAMSILLDCLNVERSRLVSLHEQVEVDARVVSALRHIQSDPVGELSIDNLAASLNMSKNAFIRLFRLRTGQTPYRFWLDWRLERAREALEMTNESVEDIAVACGFANRHIFSRHFSARFGQGPASWRVSQV